MDPNPSSPRTPRPILVLIAIWAVTQLYTFIARRASDSPGWPNERPEGIAFAVADVLQFLYLFLIVGLIGYGLVKRLRFVWVGALLWQAIEAGLGLVTFTLNDYELDAYWGFVGIPFYGIVLPLVVAVVSFLVLLLPSSRDWVRDR
jgi:hypothetical protein